MLSNTPFVIIGIYIVIALLSIVTSVLYDIRAIQLNRAAKKHPYATWRRVRPHASIVIHGSHRTSREITTNSIKANHYAHKTFAQPASPSNTPTSLIVHVQAGDTFSDTMLLEAVQSMAYFKSHTYNISPAINPADTVGAIIKNYLLIADQLFSKMRTVLDVTKSNTSIITTKDTRNYITIVYRYMSSVVAVITSVSILFSTYLAVTAEQPALLLGITAFFGVYLLMMIVVDERLTLKDKLSYCLLTPVSFPVFYIIGIMSPLFRVGSLLRSQSLFRSFVVYARN